MLEMSHTEKGYPVVVRSMPKSRFTNHGDVKKFIHEILSSRKHDDGLKPKDGATSAHNSSPSAQAEVKIRGVYFPVPSQLFPTSTTPCWRKNTTLNDDRILADQATHLSLSDNKTAAPEYRDAVVHFSRQIDAVEFSCLCEDREDGYLVDDIPVQIFNKVMAEIDTVTVIALKKRGYGMRIKTIMPHNSGVCFHDKGDLGWLIEGYEWQIILAKNVVRVIMGDLKEIEERVNLSSMLQCEQENVNEEPSNATTSKDVGCQYEEPESSKSVLTQTENWTESRIPFIDSTTQQSLNHGNGNQESFANESMYNGVKGGSPRKNDRVSHPKVSTKQSEDLTEVAESVGYEVGDSKRVSIHHQDSPAAPSKQQPEVESLHKHHNGNIPGMTYGCGISPDDNALMEQECQTDPLNNVPISKPDSGRIPPGVRGIHESEPVTSSGLYGATAVDDKSRSINSPIRTTEETRSIDDQLFGEDKTMTNFTGSHNTELEGGTSSHAEELVNDASTQTVVNGLEGLMGPELINLADHESEDFSLLGNYSLKHPDVSRKNVPNRCRSRSYPYPDCENRHVPNHSKTSSGGLSSEIQKPQFPMRDSTKLTSAIQGETAPNDGIKNKAGVNFYSGTEESNDNNSRHTATDSQRKIEKKVLMKATDYDDESMKTDDDQLNPTPGSSAVFKLRPESAKSDDKYVSNMEDRPSRKETGGPEVDERVCSGKYGNESRDRFSRGDSQASQSGNAPQMANAPQVADTCTPKMADEKNDMTKDSDMSDEDIVDDQYHDDTHSGDFKQSHDSNPEEHFHVQETSEDYFDTLPINLNFWNFIQSKDSGFRKQIDSLKNTQNVHVDVRPSTSEVRVSGEKDSVEKAMKKIRDMYIGVEFNLEERPLGDLQGLLCIEELNDSYPEVLFTCTEDNIISMVGQIDQIQPCLIDLKQKVSELSQGRGAERPKNKRESNLSLRTEKPKGKSESNLSPRTERPRDNTESNHSPRMERSRDKVESNQISATSVTNSYEMEHEETNPGSSVTTKHNKRQKPLATNDVVSDTFFSQPVMLDKQAYNFMISFHHNELGKITKFCKIHDPIVEEMVEVSVEANDETAAISLMDEITELYQTIYRNLMTETLNYGLAVCEKLKEKLSEKAVSYVIDESEDNKVIMTYHKNDAHTVGDIKKSLTLRKRERKLAKSPTELETMNKDSQMMKPFPPTTAPSSSLMPGRTLPFQASGFQLYEKTLLLVHICDITTLKVDAIVNAANGFLRHEGGVAGAISRAAGPKLDRECQDKIRRKFEYKVASVISTTAGDLPSDRVLHAVGPRWSNGSRERQDRCREELWQTFHNVFSHAKTLRVKTLATPAISSGIFGVPKDIVVDIMVEAILEHSQGGWFDEIHVVDVTDEILKMVVDDFKRRSQQSASVVSPVSDIMVQQSIRRGIVSLPQGFLLRGSTKVIIHEADITKLDVDIIVSSTNTKMWNSTGVSKAIADAAGKDLKDMCKELVKTYGGIDEGQVVITPAGNLTCTAVYHVVGPQWPSSFLRNSPDTRKMSECEEILEMAFRRILEKASSSGVASIAIPPIASGKYSIPKENLAAVLCRTLIEQRHSVKEIHVVDIKNDVLKQIIKEFSRADQRYLTIIDQSEVCNIIAARVSNPSSGAGTIARAITHQPTDRPGAWARAEPGARTQDSSQDTQRDRKYRHYEPTDTSESAHSDEGTSVDPLGVEYGMDALNAYRNGPPGLVYDHGRFSTSTGAPAIASALGGSSASQPNNTRGDGGAKPKSYADAASVHDSSYRKRQNNGGNKGHNKPSDKTQPALIKATSQPPDTCVICMADITDPKVLEKCKHKFCRECIDEAFQKCGPKCPSCGEMYGAITGTQPRGGTMNFNKQWLHLPGYDGCGSIVINYYFPSGTQGQEHPHPGRRYQGTSRTAYLPDNTEGNHVLTLLRRAFDARLVFTVGRSSTTGYDDQVIWNDIHHKTSPSGGTNQYGYPDPTYLSRVQEELAAKGIK